MSHYILECKLCHEIISQCRCPSKNKQVLYDLCEGCKEAIGKDNVLEDECQIGDIIESRNGNLFLVISDAESIALGNKILDRREKNDRQTIKKGLSVCRKVGKVDFNKYIDGQDVNW